MSDRESASAARFAVGLSTKADTTQAVDEVCRQTSEQLGTQPDLAMVFVSHHHGPDFQSLCEGISKQVRPRHLFGCTGEAIVGADRELESQPALALWLAHLPDTTIWPMHLEFEPTPEGITFTGWPHALPKKWPEGSVLLVLGEPFSFPTDELLARLNEDQPGVPVVGGMASGAWEAGQNRLFLGPRELDHGAVAALIHGPLRIRSIVSQGCRPIGRHFVITKAQQNVIQELGGVPALARLQEVFQTLPPREQELVQHGLHVGRVIDEYRDTFDRGDFLVRNVIGADTGSGALAIGELVRPGQTVQFHVRDAETADEDLRELLSQAGRSEGHRPLAALLFTCNGRGTHLFGQPHHDASVLREALGDVPVAGFFAQGEVGPVGGKNFLHGFTASIVLFESP